MKVNNYKPIDIYGCLNVSLIFRIGSCDLCTTFGGLCRDDEAWAVPPNCRGPATRGL